MAVLEIAPTASIWAVFAAIVLGALHGLWTRVDRPRNPESIPCNGQRDEVLASFRARLRGYSSGLEALASGYKAFTRHNQPFIQPAPGFDSHIILPKQHIKWLLSQPRDILCPAAFRSERFGSKYMFPLASAHPDPFLVEALRTSIPRNMGRIQGEMVDEMRRATDGTFRADGDWKEVKLYGAVHDMVFSVSVRIMFGKELCFDQGFMRCMSRLATCFGVGLVIAQLMPWPVRRVVGYLLAVPATYYRLMAVSYLWPLFSERFENIKRQNQDPDSACDYTPPEDAITWIARSALDMKHSNIDLKELANSFVVFIGTALPSSSVAGTHTLLDLLATDPQERYYDSLRSEAESIFNKPSDWSHPTASSKLSRTDSALKESLRLHPAVLHGLSRQVMPREGIILPSGQLAPQGSWLAFSVPGIHHDEEFYDDPAAYKPFRFLPTEDEPKQAMAVTTSDTFLSFGRAKASCPGRWFASHVIKMLLAYITVHYDIQPLGERPSNEIWGDHPVPSRNATIMVRKRSAP